MHHKKARGSVHNGEAAPLCAADSDLTTVSVIDAVLAVGSTAPLRVRLPRPEHIKARPGVRCSSPAREMSL